MSRIGWLGLALVVILVGCAAPLPSATPSTAPNATVLAAQRLGPRVGVAVTSERLAMTADAGATWSDIDPPGLAPGDVKTAFFRDARHGWAAGHPGDQVTLDRTTDGGKTWSGFPVGENADGIGRAYFSFVDDTSGWALVTRQSSSASKIGDLFRTRDAGATWTKLAVPTAGPIHFASPTDGWLSGGPRDDELYATHDAGTTWKRLTMDPPALFAASQPKYSTPQPLSSDAAVLAITYDGTPSGVAFFTTADLGETWVLNGTLRTDPTFEPGLPLPTDVVDAKTWLVALPGALFETTDAGASWAKHSLVSDATGINSLDFVTALDGWAIRFAGSCANGKSDCTTSTTLLATHDGGASWVRLSP